MKLYQLVANGLKLIEEGKGHLPVVHVSGSSGAADEVGSLLLSDQFGDEGPYDLDTDEYIAVIS